jgi:hypothetical protein
MLAGMGRLDRRVDRKQLRASGDLIDRPRKGPDLADTSAERVDELERIGCGAYGVADVLRDARDDLGALACPSVRLGGDRRGLRSVGSERLGAARHGRDRASDLLHARALRFGGGTDLVADEAEPA